jgi:hypothetical protein
MRQTFQASGGRILFADLCALVDGGRAAGVPEDAVVDVRISPGDRPFDSDYYYIEVTT